MLYPCFGACCDGELASLVDKNPRPISKTKTKRDLKFNKLKEPKRDQKFNKPKNSGSQEPSAQETEDKESKQIRKAMGKGMSEKKENERI